jgi:hypothetical protein
VAHGGVGSANYIGIIKDEVALSGGNRVTISCFTNLFCVLLNGCVVRFYFPRN